MFTEYTTHAMHITRAVCFFQRHTDIYAIPTAKRKYNWLSVSQYIGS